MACRPSLSKSSVDRANVMKLSLTATPAQAGGSTHPKPGRLAPILLRAEPAEAFALAAELGYDGVELHLRRPGDIDRVAVKKLAADYGLDIPMIGTGMAVEDGLTFADSDPDVRRRAVMRIREHVALAQFLGSMPVIGSIRGTLGNDPQTRPTRLASAAGCIRKCAEAAAEAGVTLLVEPINRYETDYLNTVQEALGLLHDIGSPSLKLLVDTYHMNIEEADIAASVRQAGAAIGHVHLADSNRQVPGHGHLDFPSVLRALRDVHYQGYLSLECLPLPSPRQAAEDGIRTVKPMLAALKA
jgi:sugar phosphate isomerase/epimerase